MVGGDGFEPSKSLTTDLQSAPFGHSGILPYYWSWWSESNQQPADYKSAALPVELHQQFSNQVAPKCYLLWWCLGADLNHRHADFQSTALPAELPRLVWRSGRGSNPRPPAWQAGILTNWTTGPRFIDGGASRTRTADQSVMSRPL